MVQVIVSVVLSAFHMASTLDHACPRNAWNVFESVTWLLFIGVLVYDSVNLSAVRALQIDLLNTSHFYDTWAVSGAIRGEVDLISALLYTLVIRALRYARLVPGWGPVLMAILTTIMDKVSRL